jgi:hypothetical protein
MSLKLKIKWGKSGDGMGIKKDSFRDKVGINGDGHPWRIKYSKIILLDMLKQKRRNHSQSSPLIYD